MNNVLLSSLRWLNIQLHSAVKKKLMFSLLMFLSLFSYSQRQKEIGSLTDFKNYLQSVSIGSNEKIIQTSDSNLTLAIHVNKLENGILKIVGEVKTSKGSNAYFKFSTEKLEGTIVIPGRGKAYKYYSNTSGKIIAEEVNIHSVVCSNYPKPAAGAVLPNDTTGAPPPDSEVYHLQSLPGVPYVLKLDFDGEHVVSNYWNSGNPIDALPFDITEASIIDIWKGVSEDFAPFKVNITTDEAVFQAAPVGQRMKCIFSPTDYFHPGVGGVAYIGSFTWTEDVPCWSFYIGSKNGTEIASHELGHTLALSHDGRELPTGHEEYYAGQNGWAPIMGVGYYQALTQWSKGEYQYANNTQDDISIIANTTNGFGFKPDDAGNTNATAKALNINSSGTILPDNKGIISTTADIDVYSFTTAGGSVLITVTPPSFTPDLDVLLKLTNSAGTVLSTANPATLDATITSTLAAGTYYLQIDGTGMGNPFSDGYSDYASLGEYIISGNIPVGPQNCTSAGTILREYWANVPGFSLSSIPVNTTPTSTSQLNSFDGPLNVADNYGARYRGYVCAPVTGSYTFWISSDDNSELWLSTNDNPSNKVKIASVTGWTFVNEWEKYPSQKSSAINLVAGQKYYIEALHKESTGDEHLSVGWQIPGNIIERPIPGNRLSPFQSGNNPPAVSITSPTNGQSFSTPATITINANASDTDGSITKVEFFQGATKLGEDATSPYSFSWTNVAAGGYSLTAKATDNGGAVTTSAAITITVTGSSCSASGTILREIWTNISGTSISSIPVNTSPNSSNQLILFEGPLNFGDNYGTRIRGYICAPASGSYTFWISSNDNSELWLSTNDNPSNKVKIAYVTGFTDSRQWDKYPSQKSGTINLVAGQRYYIEALHKEGVNTDHVAVGWQLPNGTQERPVPGNRLSPFQSGNNPPSVSITSPSNGQSFNAPANITINANASDTDGSIAKVEFFQGSTKLGEDATSPYSFSWTNVAAANYSLTAKATDNLGATTTSTQVNISVINNTTCSASGTINREVWNGVQGTLVTDIPTHLSPNSTSQLSVFEGPSNVGTQYGARYSGYICAPTTGNYIFWISSNDNSELWLSTDDNPATKIKIASVTGSTGIREWTKYPSQKSNTIALTAGKRYYIEALHKQGVGTDNLAVGWQLPNGTQERPIPGSRLSPYSGSQAFSSPVSLLKSSSTNEEFNSDTISVNLFPNPTEKGFITLTIEGYEKTKHKVYITITDMDGFTVYSDKLSCDITCRRTIIAIDEKFKKGLYNVTLKINGQLYSKRLMIE